MKHPLTEQPPAPQQFDEVTAMVFFQREQQEGMSVLMHRTLEQCPLEPYPGMFVVFGRPAKEWDEDPFPSHLMVRLCLAEESDTEQRFNLVLSGCKLVTLEPPVSSEIS